MEVWCKKPVESGFVQALILVMEEGAMSQGFRTTSRSWKRKGNYRKACSLANTLMLAKCDPFCTSEIWNCKIINMRRLSYCIWSKCYSNNRKLREKHVEALIFIRASKIPEVMVLGAANTIGPLSRCLHILLLIKCAYALASYYFFLMDLIPGNSSEDTPWVLEQKFMFKVYVPSLS